MSLGRERTNPRFPSHDLHNIGHDNCDEAQHLNINSQSTQSTPAAVASSSNALAPRNVRGHHPPDTGINLWHSHPSGFRRATRANGTGSELELPFAINVKVTVLEVYYVPLKTTREDGGKSSRFYPLITTLVLCKNNLSFFRCGINFFLFGAATDFAETTSTTPTWTPKIIMRAQRAVQESK